MPERESFDGQGDRYLAVFALVSLLLLLALFLVTSPGTSLAARLALLYRTGRLWIYLFIAAAPLGIGFYYWALLREEEITVTDAGIARRSHWGDETLRWEDVRAFRRLALLFKETRLGRVARLGRLFRNYKELWDRLPFTYELVGPPDERGIAPCMRLEPGTIDEMPWLLRLIEEHVGAAQ
ncbi:MAG: hypothetical protein V1772_03570 [Chloroflexota bacterium]